MEKLQQIQHASDISYHSSCLAEYEHKASFGCRPSKKSSSSELNVWAIRRVVHNKTFARVTEHVDEKLVRDRQVLALKDIFQMYSSLFEEEIAPYKQQSNKASYTGQHLCSKLLEKFPSLTKTVYKMRTFLHRADLELNELFAKGFQAEDNLMPQIRFLAFEIRRKIFEQEKRSLPKHNISVENICEGECTIPIELHALISSIVKGPKDVSNERVDVKIRSICSSIIYTTSSGTIKPSSCLCLALITKSLTGSRRMIEILNRMGHCVSYTVVEGLETELAYGCAANTNILPYGLVPVPTLRTHVAFDNYDKFVETSSGKDTLHDTVGIVYQNMVEPAGGSDETVTQPTEASGTNELEQRRRRKYQSSFDSTILPYVRQSQTSPNLVGIQRKTPENLQTAMHMNNIWMFHHALGINGASRWFAWHSERIIDENPMQNIGYLPNLNMSPTSDSVVSKTLEIAQ